MISGPSGVGKSTLVQTLVQAHSTLKFSVSYTTRPKRPGERDGVHYHFVDQTRFEQLIERGEFLESAQFNGNYYGTPVTPIRNWLSQGFSVISDIDVQGAEQLKKKQIEMNIPMCFIFILPPSMNSLKQRITARGTEDEAKREKRLQIAEEELNKASDFDVQIVNDQLDVAVEALRRIAFPDAA